MERKEILVAVLIGIVLLTVGLQTIQLAGLTKAGFIVPTNTGAQLKSGSSSDSSLSAPTNLQNIPSMVGGC